MALRVVHLGTGHALPHAERGPTATLLQADGVDLLVDCGSGTLQKLAAQGADLLTLRALLLTHAHLDHIADVAPALFALSVPGYTRGAPLALVASAETFRILDAQLAAFGHWTSPPEGTIERIVVADGDTVSIGPFDFACRAVEHTASSIGFRIGVAGSVVAIPGDTAACDGLDELIRDADLAILECSATDQAPIPGHLDPAAVGAAVVRARPRAVAIVHRYPPAAGADTEAALRDACFCSLAFPRDGDVGLVR